MKEEKFMDKKKTTKKKIYLIVAIIIAVIAIVTTVAIVIYNNKKEAKEVSQSNDKWYQDIDENHLVETDDDGNGYIDNRIIILFTKSATDEQKKSAVDSINGKIIGDDHSKYQVELPFTKSGEELDAICEDVCKLEGVFFCFKETVASIDFCMTEPNDPWKDTFQGAFGVDWNEEKPDGLNWWAETIQLASAWDYNKRFTKVKIGVVDNGFDTNHEDLDISVLNPEHNAVSGDEKDHGTHVAGIIGATANNNTGITGIVWNKDLYCVDVMPTKKQEKEHTAILDVFHGIEECLKSGCKVVNISIGGKLPSDDSDDILIYGEQVSAFLLYWEEQFERKDFIIVQAAGNDECDTIKNGFFCSITDESIDKMLDSQNLKGKYAKFDVYKHFIIVGGIQKSGNEYEIVNFYHIPGDDEFSKLFDGDAWKTRFCYGENISVVAPGRDIFSTVCSGGLNGNYGKMTGTSMAAPIVSGVVSLVWSVDPDFPAEEVKDIVCNYTDKTAKGYADGDDREYPIVNAKLAVEEAIRRTDNQGTVSAIVKETETDKLLSGVTVTFNSKAGNISRTTKTDGMGMFYIKLPVGDYEISLSNGTHTCNEYMSVKVEKDIDRTLQTPLYMTLKTGLLKATVKDKTSGAPIQNVVVTITDNLTNSYDKTATVKTDENGVFSVKLPFGIYSLYFQHDNYILDSDTHKETVVVESEENTLAEAILLSPINKESTQTDQTSKKGTISGFVKDKATKKPIKNIEVQLYLKVRNEILIVFTNNEGFFSFDIPCSSYKMTFSGGNYVTYEVNGNKTSEDGLFLGSIMLTPKSDTNSQTTSTSSPEGIIDKCFEAINKDDTSIIEPYIYKGFGDEWNSARIYDVIDAFNGRDEDYEEYQDFLPISSETCQYEYDSKSELRADINHKLSTFFYTDTDYRKKVYELLLKEGEKACEAEVDDGDLFIEIGLVMIKGKWYIWYFGI